MTQNLFVITEFVLTEFHSQHEKSFKKNYFSIFFLSDVLHLVVQGAVRSFIRPTSSGKLENFTFTSCASCAESVDDNFTPEIKYVLWLIF